MTPQIAVDITARDKTKGGAQQSEKTFRGLAKRTDGFAKDSGFSALEKQAKGFSKLAKSGFGLGVAKRDFADLAGEALRLGDATAKFTASAAASSGELGGLLGTLSKFGGPIGMAIGGVVALAGGVYLAGSKFADLGAGVGRTARTLGLANQDLQTTRASAERFGVTVETTDGALESLGDTLHGAKYGQNPMALGVLKQLGVQMKLTKTGAVDTQSTLYDLADAIAKIQDPQTQKNVAAVFGLTGMLPALRQGSAALKAEAGDFAKSGAVLSDGDIDKAQDFYRKSTKFRQDNLGALTNFAGSKAMAGADAELGVMSAAVDKIRGVGAEVAKEVPAKFREATAAVSKFTHEGIERATTATQHFVSAAEHAVQKLEAMGWSRAQALGIAGNLKKESGFNPNAVGDSGTARGIAQWHPDRQAAFRKWAGHGIDGATFDEQLGFINYELTQGSEKGAGARLRQAMTPAEAAAIVSRFYERPAKTQEEAADRSALAQGLASQLGPQKVQVEVSFKNMPAGAVARTTSAPGVNVDARVARSMEPAG